jgi:hypothetical protein
MFWKTFECEICKQAYPYLFKVDNCKVYKLVDIVLPAAVALQGGHYLVLESLPLEKNSSRTIHFRPRIVTFSPDSFLIEMKYTKGCGRSSGASRLGM